LIDLDVVDVGDKSSSSFSGILLATMGRKPGGEFSERRLDSARREVTVDGEVGAMDMGVVDSRDCAFSPIIISFIDDLLIY